jgi:hypothetical protein
MTKACRVHYIMPSGKLKGKWVYLVAFNLTVAIKLAHVCKELGSTAIWIGA